MIPVFSLFLRFFVSQFVMFSFYSTLEAWPTCYILFDLSILTISGKENKFLFHIIWNTNYCVSKYIIFSLSFCLVSFCFIYLLHCPVMPVVSTVYIVLSASSLSIFSLHFCIKMTVKYPHNSLYDKVLVPLVSELDTGSSSMAVENWEQHMLGNSSRSSVWYISVHREGCLCLTSIIYYEFHYFLFKVIYFYYSLPEQRIS